MSENIWSKIQSDNFCLKSDLEQLKNVSDINAIEAMVFYSGRVLEATSNFCVTQLGEKAKSNVFANIEYINDFNLLDETTRHWAHALRRLANQFRHILKPTEENDGAISIILLNMWLDWLINRSHLVEISKQKIPPLAQRNEKIGQQFEAIVQWLQHKKIDQIDSEKVNPLLEQPVFASVICEELINTREFDTASNFLDQALASHPNDLRLKQLKGLYLSRTGKLEQAEILLRQLLKQFPSDDETIGILAGVIKKSWQAGANDKFNQWGKLYFKGWKLSKQRNTYLGINAATFSLWSGDHESSRTIALSIIETYSIRERILKQKLNVQTEQMDYWDLATLAESYLLAGDIDNAEKRYAQLFTNAAYLGKPHEVPANQLAHHISIESVESSLRLEQLSHQHSSITQP